VVEGLGHEIDVDEPEQYINAILRFPGHFDIRDKAARWRGGSLRFPWMWLLGAVKPRYERKRVEDRETNASGSFAVFSIALNCR
jgi:hypothetical protein